MAVEIATAYLTILPSLQGSQKSISDQINRSVAPAADKAGKEAGKRLSKGISGGLKSVAGLAAGAFAVDKVTGFLKDAVSEASDLNESGTKLQQVFGKATGSVQKFASSGAKQFGQSNLALQDAAAQFGIYGKAAGLAGKSNAVFSQKLVGLSTDLASFYNVDPKQATEALAAGLRGESEPLRQFGVLLDEGSLKAQALALGLIKPVKNMADIKVASQRATLAQKKYNDAVKAHGKNSEEALTAEARLGSATNILAKKTEGVVHPLTQQQRVLAANSLIMKQTKVAQGDFAKTSGGLANQQRILAAQFKNITGTVGSFLLPIMVKLTTLVTSKLLPVVQRFFTELQTGEGTGGKVADAFKKVFDVLKDGIGFVVDHKDAFAVLFAGVAAGVVVFKTITLAMKAWTVATKVAAVATKAFAVAQKVLNAAIRANPIGLIVTALILLGTALYTAFKTNKKFHDGVVGAFKDIKKIAKGVLDWLTDAVKTTLKFIKDHWKTILAILTGPLELAALEISKHWDDITGFFSDALDWVKGVFKKGWALVKDYLVSPISDAVASIKKFFGPQGPIRVAARAVLDWFRNDFSWSKVYDVLTLPITKAIEAVTKLFGPGGKLRTAFSNAVSALGRIWDGLKSALEAPIRFVITTILNKGLIGAFNKIAGFVHLPKIPEIPLPFARGGRVRGPGSGTSDSIPARLSNGEFVQPTAAVRHYGPGFMEAIRQRKLPKPLGFRTGGLVNFQGGRFTPRFAAQLKLAEQLAGTMFNIFQGGWRPATSYSGTSHRGDAVDLGPVTAADVKALRAVGFAAWDRTNMGNWAPHIHAVPLPGFGTPLGSAIWQGQDYLRGGNGLGGRDNGLGSGDHSTPGGALGAIGGFLKGAFTSVTGFFKHLIEAPLAKLSQITDSPFGKIVAAIPHAVADGIVDKIGGFAGGTNNAEAGLAWVGERGPELVNFHGGEQVFPHGVSRGMASGGVTINGDINGYTAEEVAREIETRRRQQAALHPVRV